MKWEFVPAAFKEMLFDLDEPKTGVPFGLREKLFSIKERLV